RNTATAAGQPAGSFAQQLARQRDHAVAHARPNAGAPGKTAGGKPGGDVASGQEPATEAQESAQAADPAAAAAAAAAAAGTAAIQVQPPPAQAVAPSPAALPAQAIEVAAQAAQLQHQAGPSHGTAATAVLAGTPAAQTAVTPDPMAHAAAGQTAATMRAAAAAAPGKAAEPRAAAAAGAGASDARAAARDARAVPTPASRLAAMTLGPLTRPDGEVDLALNGATGNPSLAGAGGPPAHTAGTDLAAGLAAATPLHATRPDTLASSLLPSGVGPLALGIGTPVAATPAWGADLGRQLLILTHDATQGRQTAELRLDPPDLGPLRVTLSVNDGVASASFVSAHAAVRHAVEAALPQLQQALAQTGLSLGQASVGEHGAQSGFDMQQQNSRSQGQGGGHGEPAVALVPEAPALARRSDGLVDTFA
ncbi:MAG TPA: flagellar hook-length control protein FliK, partial [Bordetella sp.]|nr:flagellar hook-length control protein FliK [Bordetella sp.]